LLPGGELNDGLLELLDGLGQTSLFGSGSLFGQSHSPTSLGNVGLKTGTSGGKLGLPTGSLGDFGPSSSKLSPCHGEFVPELVEGVAQLGFTLGKLGLGGLKSVGSLDKLLVELVTSSSVLVVNLSVLVDLGPMSLDGVVVDGVSRGEIGTQSSSVLHSGLDLRLKVLDDRLVI